MPLAKAGECPIEVRNSLVPREPAHKADYRRIFLDPELAAQNQGILARFACGMKARRIDARTCARPHNHRFIGSDEPEFYGSLA